MTEVRPARIRRYGLTTLVFSYPCCLSQKYVFHQIHGISARCECSPSLLDMRRDSRGCPLISLRIAEMVAWHLPIPPSPLHSSTICSVPSSLFLFPPKTVECTSQIVYVEISDPAAKRRNGALHLFLFAPASPLQRGSKTFRHRLRDSSARSCGKTFCCRYWIFHGTI